MTNTSHEHMLVKIPEPLAVFVAKAVRVALDTFQPFGNDAEAWGCRECGLAEVRDNFGRTLYGPVKVTVRGWNSGS